jgi:hypothetical protein
MADSDTASVSRALQALAPPRHGREFWTALDERLSGEPQLRLAPRSAIRPITQPPPITDDRNLIAGLKGGSPPPKPSSRRTVVLTVVTILAVLIGLAALQDDGTGDPDAATPTSAIPPPGEDGAAGAGEDVGADEGTAGDEGDGDEAAATTVPPGTVDPAAPLTAAGVGPLQIGASMADLEAEGVVLQVDDSTFRGSGGTCYDAKVPGALDLVLRFRAPDGQRRAQEPNQGVLTSVAIESALPTNRGTDTGVTLGVPPDQVLMVHAGNVDERSHPFEPGGRIYRADAGNGLGLAYFTDGQVVNRIAVGEWDTIRYINQCS